MLLASETGSESTSPYLNKMPPELKNEIPKESDIKNNFKRFEDVQLPIDILLLTVKDIEFRSCYFNLTNAFQSYGNGLGYVYFGEMGEVGDTKLKVALFKCSEGATNPGGALIAVQNTVKKLRPKAVFCVGCCGALHRDKTKLGDVVVSAKLTTYADKRVTNQGVHSLGFRVPVSAYISGLIQCAGYGWKAPLKNEEEGGLVKVHSDGEFLSGPEEIDSEERRLELVKFYPNAIAVEMDGQGVFSAAHDLKTEWVVIKGVSCYVDGTASLTEDWKPFASAMAASVVKYMLRIPAVFEGWPHYQSSDMGRAPNEDEGTGKPIVSTLVKFATGSLFSDGSTRQLFQADDREPVMNSGANSGRNSPDILWSLLHSVTSESGQRKFKGRVINYKAEGRIHKLKWVYDGTAWDVESGTSVKARHYNSAQGANEHAVKKLIDDLKAKGILS